MEVGYPRWGEVTRVFGGGGGGGVGNRPVPIISYLLSSLDHVYMVDRMTCLGGLPGLLVMGRLTLSAGVTVCNVNMSWWGNPPGRDRVHVTKMSKTIPKQTVAHRGHAIFLSFAMNLMHRTIKSKYRAINGKLSCNKWKLSHEKW